MKFKQIFTFNDSHTDFFCNLKWDSTVASKYASKLMKGEKKRIKKTLKKEGEKRRQMFIWVFGITSGPLSAWTWFEPLHLTRVCVLSLSEETRERLFSPTVDGKEERHSFFLEKKKCYFSSKLWNKNSQLEKNPDFICNQEDFSSSESWRPKRNCRKSISLSLHFENEEEVDDLEVRRGRRKYGKLSLFSRFYVK